MKPKIVIALVLFLGLSSLNVTLAASSKKHRVAERIANKFAQSSFRELLIKKRFKLVKNENRPLTFDKDDLTYTQNLMFKTARGFICQGGLSFDVSLDKRVEKNSLWTNLSCYKIKTNRKNKRRKS